MLRFHDDAVNATALLIVTLPGYDFSEPLKQLDFVWTAETVSKLFEVGPAANTPGTRMPEQVIASAQDLRSLIRFRAGDENRLDGHDYPAT